MFKKITIHLRYPLCSCDKEDLAWAITMDAQGKAGLRLICNTCKTQVTVPPDQFKATFDFAHPYKIPKGTPEKKEPHLKGLDGGKLLKFDEKGPSKPEGDGIG